MGFVVSSLKVFIVSLCSSSHCVVNSGKIQNLAGILWSWLFQPAEDSHYLTNKAFKSQQRLPSREWITNLVSQYPIELILKMTYGEICFHDWRWGSFLPSQIGMPWRMMACLPYLAPGVPSVITKHRTERRKLEVRFRSLVPLLEPHSQP